MAAVKIPVKEPAITSPPATKTEVVADHVTRQRPVYIWLPIAGVAVWATIHVYKSLSGRSPVDDVPIGALWNLIGLIVVISLVTLVKGLAFDDIDTTDRTIPWWHVCLDYLATFFLYTLFWYAISH